MIESHEGGFDVSGEFGGLREKRAEELARAFIEGGVWLARQKDPVRQFERIVAGEYLRTSMQKREANRQFGEIVQTGHPDYGRMFDAFAALSIFRISPETFMSAVVRAHAQRIEGRMGWEDELRRGFLDVLDKNLGKKEYHDRIYSMNSLKKFYITEHFRKNMEKNFFYHDAYKKNYTKRDDEGKPEA